MKTAKIYSKIRIAGFLLIISNALISQINITALPFSPAVTNFNTYNPTSAANALSTIPSGWSFSSVGTPIYNGRTILPSNNGGYWGFETLLGGDINLGALRNTGTGNISYQVNYVNNTGGLITSLVLSWNYEQWCFANTSGWDCSGTGALAGNVVLNSKDHVGVNFSLLNIAVITPVPQFTLSGLSIPNGAAFGFIWTTTDDAGADNGVAIDDFAITANATPSITLANGSIPAANIYQTSANNVLYRTDITVAVSPATLTSTFFSTTGGYLPANISNLKLWYSNTSVFSAGTSTLLFTKTTNLGQGSQTFSGLSQRFSLGTGYLFLTTDIPCSTTLGNSINVNAISTGNLTFGTGTISGSGFTAGGSQTFVALTLNAVGNQSVCAGKSTAAVNFVTLPAGLSIDWTNNNTSIGLAASGNGNISAYTASAVSSNQTGNILVTPSSGACVGTPVSFNMVVKNNGQSSSVWTGAISSNWNDAANWSNCACASVTDATIAAVSTPSFNPVINGSANFKNLTINSGATLSVQNSQALNLYGNWTNNGSFDPENGAVVLAGNSQQTIGGSAATTFYDLVLNNAAGANLSSAQNIKGTLLLNSGVFNTTNLLTLMASASGSGKIGPINPNADITGNVTVQQYAPGGTTGWALLGSPLSSSQTMADWNDDFAVTCLSCPDGYNNFPSIYTYNEAIPGDYSAPNKYVPITNITDNIQQGKGYWVYLGNGSVNTSAISFDVTGQVAKSACLSCGSAVSIPLSYTSNNGAANDGWNLISNPLPSPISWTALRNGNTHIDDAIYVYNADLSNGQGAHASFVNGVSSDITGGITDNIAMCQAFYVHTSAPTTLTAGEDVKTDSNPVFLRSGSATKPVFRLVMDSYDMTTFYFEQGGAKNFQKSFDAYKLNFSSNPYIGSMSDSVLTSISGLPELISNITVPVKAITPTSGSFTFSSLQENFPKDVCVTLYDSFTGITTNILNSSYICTLYDTTTTVRFKMNFFTTPSSGTGKILSQPICGSPDNGIIFAQGSGKGPWNYEWKSGNTAIQTSINKSTPDSSPNLTGGNYSVKITNAGGCEYFTKSFTINPVVTPSASFSPNVFTTALSSSGKVLFTNHSSGSQINSWDFGDNSGTWFGTDPSHNYTSPGVYTVTLITESKTNCKDTTQQTITVIDDLTGISNSTITKDVRILTHSPGKYELSFSFDQGRDIMISIFDLKGTLLVRTELQQITHMIHPLDLETFSSGMYLVKITSESTGDTFKLIK